MTPRGQGDGVAPVEARPAAPAHGQSPAASPGDGTPAGGAGAGAATGLAPLRAFWRMLREGGALMVGVPDYDRYVEHMRAQHPELAPMTREAFVRARMEARYGGKGTGKCPC